MSEQDPFSPLDTILALAREIGAGTVRSEELVERALANAETRKTSGSHALTRIWREESLAAARREDRLRDQGMRPSSPLAGVPVVVKDNCDVRGDITQAGSGSLQNALPAQRDADCVAQLRSAGAVIIGKSNMSEFACVNTGANDFFGIPTNPRDPLRLVGGSSSGAAAAVAEGSVVAALGSDTGGSIRGPAALCGLAGFKPSEGRISTQGVLPLSTTLDTLGPIARTVECCAIMDAALAGNVWRPLPEISLKGLSLGVLQDLVLDDLDPAVASAFENALRVLKDAGVTVSEFSWPELRSRDWRTNYATITHGEMYLNHGRFAESHSDQIERKPHEIIMSGKAISPQDRADAEAFRAKASLEAHDIISPYHAVVFPTVPLLAPLISSLSDPNADEIESILGRNNEPANFFDCCAATLPCQREGKLPVGFLMMAKNGEDRRVLTIASAVEKSLRVAGFA
ncbi:amidase family protein [Mesorhizobium sp. M1233]|uniref:amidase family protein n=1 Tax=Mesorhizobium sp. M1233 TaxID=2957072 RepID=UPI00333AEF94